MDVRRVSAAEAHYHLPQGSSAITEDDFSGIDWNEIFLFTDEDDES